MKQATLRRLERAIEFLVIGIAVLYLAAVAANAQQAIDYRDPPDHPFVLSATVPVPKGSPPLVVVGADLSDFRKIASTDEYDIAEVRARVPAGTTRAILVPGTPTRGVPRELRFVAGSLRLEVDGVVYDLTRRAQLRGIHQLGSASSTIRFHADLPAGVGVETFVTVRAGLPQLDVGFLLHHGVPGGDFRFDYARLLVPSGATFSASIPDPAVAPPYLVAPSADNIIPQQFGRPFWIRVYLEGAVPEPEHVGTADWSRGGYLPAGFPVPDLPGAAESLAAELTTARYRLANLLPEETYDDPPVSALWPAGGLYYGGAGGGTGRLPLDGIRWAASRGYGGALELARIELLRGQARARIRLGPEGDLLDLDAAAGSWSFWDGFLGGHDEPWNWDSYSTTWVARDPRIFQDHDLPGMLRRVRSAWKLAWLANDPVARLLSLEAATRARLTFWEGPGIAHRLDPVAENPGHGSAWGVWQGVSGIAVAVARSLGATEYEGWRATFLSHLASAQMPSGEVTNRLGGYPASNPPFFDVYRLAGQADTSYLALALYELGDREVVRGIARAVEHLGTPTDGRAGLYYYWPVSLAEPPFTEFSDQSEWFPWTAPFMGQNGTSAYLTAWDQGYLTAIAVASGAPNADVLVGRFADVAIMRTWGLVAPDTHTRAPVEQWWPLLGELEHGF